MNNFQRIYFIGNRSVPGGSFGIKKTKQRVIKVVITTK